VATDLFIVIAAGFVGGVVARRNRHPLVLGYLVAGIVVGPFTGGITVGDPQNLETIGRINGVSAAAVNVTPAISGARDAVAPHPVRNWGPAGRSR
jgi:mannose/fructose/N-acetylgalactosamine-specific phosphotransferase system component IIC